jgi:hypothetical protein
MATEQFGRLRDRVWRQIMQADDADLAAPGHDTAVG